jgi:hypothetical protein
LLADNWEMHIHSCHLDKSVAELVYKAKVKANFEQAFGDRRTISGMTAEALRE